MTFNREMGQCVSAWRRNAGLSQETLARAIGMTPTALSKIENGRQVLSVEAFLSLLSALELTMDDVSDDLPKPSGLEEKRLWERIND